MAIGDIHDHVESLMATAPGRVHVSRIVDLDDADLLRRYRDSLSPDEQTTLSDTLRTVKQNLIGIEVATPPKAKKKSKWRLLGGIATAMASQDERQADQWRATVNAAGGPAKLAPPPGLIAAAEAWIVAELVADRASEDLAVLRAPWEQAAVGPTGSS